MQKICLDAGILSLFFSKNVPPKVNLLMESIKTKKIECFILKPVLCEVFFHICQLRGRDEANEKIISFIRKYTPNLVELDESLILETGYLKCHHRTTLSYIDCMSIGFCLNEKLPFYTTEKNLKNIPNSLLSKLKVVKYNY